MEPLTGAADLRPAAGLLCALFEAKVSVIFWLAPPPAPGFLEPLDMILAVPAPSIHGRDPFGKNPVFCSTHVQAISSRRIDTNLDS